MPPIVSTSATARAIAPRSLKRLDGLLAAETVIFVDAYATDIELRAKRLRHPERLVGYGILGSLDGQRAVEIVDSETARRCAGTRARGLFASIGKGSVAGRGRPGLFLGRTVGSIVNEASSPSDEEVAIARGRGYRVALGANYPLGPIAWGREIGGARIKRILQRLAAADGERVRAASLAVDPRPDRKSPHPNRCPDEPRRLGDRRSAHADRAHQRTARERAPDDLAAAALRAVVRRSGVAPEAIDDVYFGAANQSGEDNRNVARMAVLLAQLPVEVPGVTLNRLCASSLAAINSAAHAIAFGDADVVVAGGVESMTRAPYVLPKSDAPFGRKQHLYDTVLGWRMTNPAMPIRLDASRSAKPPSESPNCTESRATSKTASRTTHR